MIAPATTTAPATAPAAPRSTDEVEHVLVAVRRLMRAVRVASAEVERTAGLSAAQLLVLDSAGARPGASIAELATATMTDRSSVAVVIDPAPGRNRASRSRPQRQGSPVQRR